MAQVITTILLEDNPNGVKLVELSNWKGSVFVIPRGHLSGLRERNKLNEPGIYFLFGEGEDHPVVYIGQSENCYLRLVSHDREREEEQWNVAMVFTGGLHSTYIKYLESIAVKKATEAGRYEVINKTVPGENQLTEAHRVTADEFFLKMQFLVIFFGFNLFQDTSESVTKKTTYYLEEVVGNVSARGSLLDSGKFIVFEGSKSRVEETPSFIRHVRTIHNLRKNLEEEGTLKNDGTNYTSMKDHIFHSPSQASATVAAQARNGWTSWKDKDGRTLDENVRQVENNN